MARTAWWVVAALAAGWRCQSPAQPQAAKVHGGLDAPRAVVVADLDGDGDRDVVVAEAGAGRVALFLNERGVLGTPRTMPAGPMPSDLRSADLERDGDLDLIVANHETSHVTLLRNDGRAGFTADPVVDAGSRPHHHAAAVADLDGDGSIDLALDSSGDDTVRILLGARAPARAFAACDLPYHMVGAGDVTGDGVADLLVPCQGSRTLAIVTGASKVVATVPLPITPFMVQSADLDGDRRPEIVVAGDNAVIVLRGDTRSGFTQVPGSPFTVAIPNSLATGDLDGDGLNDLAIGPWDGDEVTIILGGSFRRASMRAAARPILAIGDVDGEGPAELVAASTLAGTLHVLRFAG